jgi:carbonic anhydrase
MKTLHRLLESNRAWAARRRHHDATYFEKLSGIQRPDYLWIGCSDSRVPANEIVGLEPGELFVHRNVANIVVPGDPNCMAVVQYAIEALEVRHIIVCGHYGCGGVRAVLDNQFDGGGHVERWLTPLRHIAYDHSEQLGACTTHEERWNLLCEINVHEQVARLEASDVLRSAKLRGIDVFVHGLIYSIRDGVLREVASRRPLSFV